MASRCILSTGNVMTAGAQVIRKPTLEKSNTELVNSLRENFKEASSTLPLSTNPNIAATSNPETRLAPEEWTKLGSDGVLYVPTESGEPHGLAEDREEYDVTVKLFYLPGVPSSSRCRHTEEAVRLVCKELGISSIDLLIVSFPNISFDAEDEDISSEEDVSEWVRTYRTLEGLHSAKKISKIGLAEFGATRLSQLLPQTNVKPSVDQINVRDCCVVPKPLILYAKERGIELLTHNDCTDILPVDTLRQLVVDEFGLFRADAKLVPQWVVKYTAVIRSRGVVENKGRVN
ncbi:unnamed protein product [Tuber melanosporum]|uniref:GCS light chain n=1 Tax=Tuber melanosporum (strain Mel28) TaxID=656061 RepID=D5GGY1_TUBMM|nr:uncharacterized protein GSTUM_00007611001 [Tuber melanosporum]CAZ83774.1 unnamed protein product [Tuber melanosporum]